MITIFLNNHMLIFILNACASISHTLENNKVFTEQSIESAICQRSSRGLMAKKDTIKRANSSKRHSCEG